MTAVMRETFVFSKAFKQTLYVTILFKGQPFYLAGQPLGIQCKRQWVSTGVIGCFAVVYGLNQDIIHDGFPFLI